MFFEQHHRAVLAYGAEAQHRLDLLRVTFVGVGGLGAEIAVGLGRIASASMTFIEPDRVEFSNLPRLSGLVARNVGELKAAAMAEVVRKLPGAPVVRIVATDVDAVSELDLFDADWVVVTADSPAARAVVQIRAAEHHFEGHILFAAASIEPGVPSNVHPRRLGRVTCPPRSGAWCVLCTGVVDRIAAAVDLDVPEYIRRRVGYGDAATVAQVTWWNMRVASAALQVIHEHTGGLLNLCNGLDRYFADDEMLEIEHGDVAGSRCSVCEVRLLSEPDNGPHLAAPPTRRIE